MMKRTVNYYLSHLGSDISAGIVVFLVALPLCLGIALASGAPLFAGIIAGIVGGLVVSWASGSQLSVSGPAAGLTVIVFAAIEQLGGLQVLLLSVVLAGILQLLLGFLGAGVIGAYFPSAVIKGMLAAIGLILILKQIPHAVGYDSDFIGDEAYLQADTHTTLSEIEYALRAIEPGALIVSVVSILIMLLWDTKFVRANRLLRLVPGPLLAVLWGLSYDLLTPELSPSLTIAAKHLVQLPAIGSFSGFFGQLSLPDFTQIANPAVWQVAATLAIVASLETLLSLEATDKLDPLRRVAPTNRELKAQGLGNVVSGMLGGLPITAVIVRSSANINAGAHTKVSCFVHGLLLLVSVTFVAKFLNLVPLASLAAILLLTGYKLAKPSLFLDLYRKGTDQIVPFVITILAILFTDLLKGIAIGLLCGLYYVVRANFQAAISLTQDGPNYLLRLQKDVSFLNKALLRNFLDRIEPNSYVIIDGRRAQFVDQDILETISDFRQSAQDSEITVEVRGLDDQWNQATAPRPEEGASVTLVTGGRLAEPPIPSLPLPISGLNATRAEGLTVRG